MLCLQNDTPQSFVTRFEAHLGEMLLDHAHCEKKAASAALSMMFRYPEHPALIRTLADIVEEEMAHFKLVLALMDRRGFSFTKQKPSAYAGRLATQVRGTQGKDELVDRLLTCALIEARSCERFKLLGDHLSDPELAEFYRSLFESEARHYATYLKMALALDSEAAVRARLAELVAHEAMVCRQGESLPRLHA